MPKGGRSARRENEMPKPIRIYYFVLQENLPIGGLNRKGQRLVSERGTGGKKEVPLKIVRLFLLVNALAFLINGFVFLIAPQAMLLWYLGAPAPNVGTLAETRAIFGGMGFGIGLFFLDLLRRDPSAGVRGGLTVLASILAARLIAVPFQGVPSGPPLVSMCGEIVLAALGVAAWVFLRSVRPVS